MKELLGFLRGKKAYLVAIVVGVLAALNSLGIIVPDYVYTLLAACGIAAVRAAIK